VWERVPGAIVELKGEPGDDAALRFRVRYDAGNYEGDWTYAARCGDDGVARIRVPLATDAPNGDGRVLRAEWRCGERSGSLVVPQAAVRAGSVIAP